MTGHRPISARQVRVILWWLLVSANISPQIIDPGHINPETPKMPQKLVDKIPLVLYIPAPSSPVKATNTTPSDPDAIEEVHESSAAPPTTPADHPSITKPPSALVRGALVPRQPSHSYPPDTSESPLSSIAAPDALVSQQPPRTASLPEANTLAKPHPRFTFFRRKKSKSHSSSTGTSPKSEAPETAADGESEEEWEDRYEKSSLPFVRLENNRATCAICLMDFDEPPRKKTKGKAASNANNRDAAAGPSTTQSNTEPEPLRLLECGHVFHVRLRCVSPLLAFFDFCLSFAAFLPVEIVS
jgi:hypothetical protein